MKKAAFFDLDGTLTTRNVWGGLIEYFVRHRIRLFTFATFVSYHYSRYGLRRLGFISERDFRSAWTKDLARFLRGYSIEQAEEVWDWVVEERVNELWRADTRAILREHLDAGDVVLLVSGGPFPLLKRIARELNVEHAISTHFEINEGRYTGRGLDPVCIEEYKAILSRQYLEECGIVVDMAASCAYADSITDVQLLEMVGSPVAVYPDGILEAVARERGWKIFP